MLSSKFKQKIEVVIKIIKIRKLNTENYERNLIT
jgi:hypothetical protein